MDTRAPRSIRFLLAAVALSCAVFMGAVGLQAQRSTLATRSGTPSGAVDLGVLPASQTLQLTLQLAPPSDRTAALDQYLTDLATSSSTNFHKWLTPSDFAAQFGATADQVSAVTGWLQANGFSVNAVSAGGMWVSFSGTTAQAEQAFAPALHQYALGAARVFANSVQPTVPASIAQDVAGVHGLDNLPVPGATACSARSFVPARLLV